MRVFLSYSNIDAQPAKRIADFLRKDGFEVWDDTQLFPGENWARQVSDALEKSDAMVVLITPNALHSSQITHEIGYALGKKDYKGRLVPVVLPSSGKQLRKKDIPWVLNSFQKIYFTDKNKTKALKEISQALRGAT